MRRASPALRTGTLRPLPGSSEAPGVVAFLREAEGDRVLVVHNVGATPATVSQALPGAPMETITRWLEDALDQREAAEDAASGEGTT